MRLCRGGEIPARQEPYWNIKTSLFLLTFNLFEEREDGV